MFSAAKTPRRHLQQQQQPGTSKTPLPAASTTRSVTGTRPNSTASFYAHSVATSVGGGRDSVLAQNDRRILQLVSHMPSDLQQIIRQTPPSGRELFRVAVDGRSSLAVLSCPARGCFLWSTRASGSLLASIVVPDLMRDSSGGGLVYAQFIAPAAGSDAVALLLVSAGGHVRYWGDAYSISSSVSVQLSSSSFVQIPLAGGDCVDMCSAFSLDLSCVVVGCRSGRLYCVRFDAGALNIASCDELVRSMGLRSLLPFGAAAGGGGVDSKICALVWAPIRVVAGVGMQDLFVVGKSSVRVWRLSRGVNKFISEQLAFNSLLKQEVVDICGSSDGIDVQIIDAAAAKEGRLVVLASVVINGELRFMLAWLDRKVDSPFTIRLVRVIETIVSETDVANAKLLLSNGGPMAFILTDNVILTSLLSTKTSYDDAIPFKSSSRAKFMGAFTDVSKLSHLSKDVVSECLIAMWPHGIVSLKVMTEAILNDPHLADKPTVATHSLNRKRVAEIRSVLEQAIIYGQQDNAVAFDIPAQGMPEVSDAVISLVSDILSSNLPYLSTMTEIKDLLVHRWELLLDLEKFLRASNALVNMHETSRLYLMWSMEKVVCGMTLWNFHNSYVSQHARQERLVEVAVENCLADYGDNSRGYAALRTLFKTHLSNVMDVLLYIFADADPDSVSQDGTSLNCSESNRLLVDFFAEAYSVRHEMTESLGLETKVRKSWMGSAKVAELLLSCFQRAFQQLMQMAYDASLRESDMRRLGNNGFMPGLNQEDSRAIDAILAMRAQLAEIGKFCLQVFQEVCESDNNEGYGTDEALSAKLKSCKSEVAISLAKAGDVDGAYKVASTWRDYVTLVELAFFYEDDAEGLLVTYCRQLGEPFVMTYFDHLMNQERLDHLLELPNDYDQYLPKYFEREHMIDLKWMLALKNKNYAEAGPLLIHQATRDSSLPMKRNLLSMAKLTFIAGLQASQISAAIADVNLTDIDALLEELEQSHDIANSRLASDSMVVGW